MFLRIGIVRILYQNYEKKIKNIVDLYNDVGNLIIKYIFRKKLICEALIDIDLDEIIDI